MTRQVSGLSFVDANVIEGEDPVLTLITLSYGLQFMSRVPWEWSANWVVAFIRG
jgi:hypothetical protein